MTVRKVRIARPFQCQVIPETGAVLLVGPGANDDDVLIEFADLDCAREFASNAVDAMACVVVRNA